jgi:transposase-like protein
MKCPRCSKDMKKVYVEMEGAGQKAISYQCPSCDYVEFDPESSAKVVEELKAKETP